MRWAKRRNDSPKHKWFPQTQIICITGFFLILVKVWKGQDNLVQIRIPYSTMWSIHREKLSLVHFTITCIPGTQWIDRLENCAATPPSSRGCMSTSCYNGIPYSALFPSKKDSRSMYAWISGILKFYSLLCFLLIFKASWVRWMAFEGASTNLKPQVLFLSSSQTQTFWKAWKHAATLVWVSFPGPLFFLVLASTTQKSCNMSHFHGILNSAKNKKDRKFRENGYS